MASDFGVGPSASTLDVETLVHRAWDGKIRVPHFQRDFRWGWEDVRRLFDSVVKGYPIGSLLLWVREGPEEPLRLGGLDIEAPELKEAWWVVDGQQRLTSLANALHPSGQNDSRFDLAYDLRKKEFVRTPAIEDPLVVPLPVLFDLQRLLTWFADNPDLRTYLDEATQVTRRLRQYVVPLYVVDEENPEVLQDIFDRMNNYGKRLSRAEIFSALNAGDEIESRNSPSFDKIALGIQEDLNFGLLDNDTILAAILARRGSDIRRDIRHEFDSAEDEGRDRAYVEGEASLRRAISFLQNQASVPHVTMLAYRYLLIVLTRFFGLYPSPDDRSLQLLRRWYWRAAMAGPEQFKGGTPNAARLLCTQVVEGDINKSVSGLLAAIGKPATTSLDIDRFSTREASTKMLLCALWSLEPRDLVSGERFTIGDLAASLGDQQTARAVAPHWVPSRNLPRDVSGLPGNRLLYPSSETDPREVSGLFFASSRGMDLTRRELLHSLGIDEDADEDFQAGFLEAAVERRQKELRAIVDVFTMRMSEWDFEDTPAIDSFILDDDA